MTPKDMEIQELRRKYQVEIAENMRLKRQMDSIQSELEAAKSIISCFCNTVCEGKECDCCDVAEWRGKEKE